MTARIAQRNSTKILLSELASKIILLLGENEGVI